MKWLAAASLQNTDCILSLYFRCVQGKHAYGRRHPAGHLMLFPDNICTTPAKICAACAVCVLSVCDFVFDQELDSTPVTHDPGNSSPFACAVRVLQSSWRVSRAFALSQAACFPSN
jgi:hypothetical protein